MARNDNYFHSHVTEANNWTLLCETFTIFTTPETVPPLQQLHLLWSKIVSELSIFKNLWNSKKQKTRLTNQELKQSCLQSSKQTQHTVVKKPKSHWKYTLLKSWADGSFQRGRTQVILAVMLMKRCQVNDSNSNTKAHPGKYRRNTFHNVVGDFRY